MRWFVEVKVLSLLLVLSTVISLFPASGFTGEIPITVSVGSVSTAPGSIIEVPVKISNIPASGFSTGKFDIDYDREKLKYMSFTVGPVVNKSADITINQSAGGIIIMYSDYDQTGSSYIKEDGLFLTLSLEVNGDCTVGDSIYLSVKTSGGFYDRDMSSLPTPLFNIGNVSIEPIQFSIYRNEETSSSEGLKYVVNLSYIPADGLSSALLDLNYDTSKFAVKRLIAGDIVANKAGDISYFVNTRGLSILYSDSSITGSSHIKENGKFFTLEFSAYDGDDYPIFFPTVISLYDSNTKQLPMPTFLGFNAENTTTPTNTSTITPTITPTLKLTVTPTRMPTGTLTLDDPIKVSIGQVSVWAGSTCQVEVRMDNIPEKGLASAIFNMDYDISKLRFKSLTPGEIVTNKKIDAYTNGTSTGLKIYYYDSDQTGTSLIKENGVFCTLEFDVMGSIENISIKLFTNNKFYDEEINKLPTPIFVSDISDIAIYDTPLVTPTNTPTPTLKPTITITPTIKPTILPTLTPIKVSVSKASIEDDDTCNVKIRMDNIPEKGLISAIFNVDYDTSKLIYKGFTVGEIVGNKDCDVVVNLISSGVKIMYSDYDQTGTSHIKEDGILCTLSFSAASDIEYDDILMNAYTSNNFYDVDIMVLPTPVFETNLLFATPTVIYTPTPTNTKHLPVILESSTSAEVKEPGDSVTMNVYVDYVSSAGWSNGLFNIDYEINKLEYVSHTTGPVVYKAEDILISSNLNGLTVSYADSDKTGSSYIKTTGLLCTITFRIKDLCLDEDISFYLNTTNEFYDKDLQSFTAFFYNNAKVIVMDQTVLLYGDFNGDGAVRANDYAMIRDYTIGKINDTDLEYRYALRAGDVNKDGELKTNDFAIVRDYIIGKVEVLPYIE